MINASTGAPRLRSPLLIGATAALFILPGVQALAQSRTVEAVGPEGGTVERTLRIEDGAAVREVSRRGPEGAESDKVLVIREGTAERDVIRTGPNGGSQSVTSTLTTGSGGVVRTGDGSVNTYAYDERIDLRQDRRSDRRDFREDRRDSRQGFREDRRDDRQDRRSDRRDRREDRRDDRRDRRGG